MIIETKRWREKFEVDNNEYRVLLDCTNGDSEHSHTLHYYLEPAYAKQLAYAILAEVAKIEQEKK